MKFVFVCSEYPPDAPAGIGVLLSGLCQQLAARGIEIHVVGNQSIARGDIRTHEGVVVHRLPRHSGPLGLAWNRLALRRKIAQIAATGPIDLIESPDFEAPSAFLPRQSRRRVVRLHGSHTYFAAERGQVSLTSVHWLEAAALRQADAWLAVSKYTAERTEQLFGFCRPMHVVHNAANVSARYLRKDTYAPWRRVVYFGTLAEKKGVLTLARAWRDFHESHPNWSLTLIGRDTVHSGRSIQEAMTELAGIAATSMTFTGPLSNEAVMTQLHGFDFAVLPSFSETFALAPMEAMAVGLPVIYSQLSSGPELIEHGVDGWLADPRDPPQLARLIAEVADDSVRREQVGRAGRALIGRSFSHEAFIENNLEVYRQIGLNPKSA